jgi:uncharacterized protein GlcG (DUF336 family)
MTQPTGAADPGLLPALSVSAALAQRAIGAAREAASGLAVPVCIAVSMLQTEGALLHGIVKTDRLVIFGGGAPIRSGRHLVGAVGVSGGSEEQDGQIAKAAASSLFLSESGERG